MSGPRCTWPRPAPGTTSGLEPCGRCLACATQAAREQEAAREREQAQEEKEMAEALERDQKRAADQAEQTRERTADVAVRLVYSCDGVWLRAYVYVNGRAVTVEGLSVFGSERDAQSGPVCGTYDTPGAVLDAALRLAGQRAISAP